MRKMDIKVKVCKEKLLIDLIRITCACAAGQKWYFFPHVYRNQSEPCTFHCGSDRGSAGGDKSMGPARTEGHGCPVVRCRLVVSHVSMSHQVL